MDENGAVPRPTDEAGNVIPMNRGLAQRMWITNPFCREYFHEPKSEPLPERVAWLIERTFVLGAAQHEELDAWVEGERVRLGLEKIER